MLVLLGATRVAVAGDRTCYAGTETHDMNGESTRYALVVERELDRDAGEIRVRYWTDSDSEYESTRVYKVDATAGTLEFTAAKTRGTGTLVGAPWRWTAYHMQFASPQSTMVNDGELRGASLTETARFQSRTLPNETRRWEATAFDCGELDKRRRALDPASSPTAVRVCFAGTTTSDSGTLPTILVQTIDRKRIELRQRNGRARHDQIRMLTIDGDKVLVDGVVKPAKLLGKPGAWTGYALTDKGPNGVLTFTDEGTLGGTHAVRTWTAAGPAVTATVKTDAAQFDCKELESRRAAMPR